MSFTIMTDTSANLPSAFLRKHKIEAVPFSYYIDDKEYTCTDTEAFDGSKYYDGIRNGVNVTTSQINPQKYIEYMKPVLDKGEDILFINMSSGISGAYNSAKLAVSELKESYPDRKIRLIDTLGASLGEGMLVLRAVRYRSSGMSIDDTAEKLLSLRRRICQVFMVDDLMHLRKSGRISGAVAILGSMLQIKPLLKGNEKGQIVNFGKARGRKKAIEALAQKYETLVENAKQQIVCIAHTDCENDAHYLEKLLRRNKPPKEIMTVCYEPVTGSHVGPGALALFFEGGENVRSLA